MPDSREKLTSLERDVLLASSGELPWRRRLTLAFRLRHDASARRLAETLAVAEMAVGRTMSPAASRRTGIAPWLVPTLATAACAFFLIVLASRNDEDELENDPEVRIEGLATASLSENAEALVFSILTGTGGLGAEPLPISEQRILEPIPEPPDASWSDYSAIPEPRAREEN